MAVFLGLRSNIVCIFGVLRLNYKGRFCRAGRCWAVGQHATEMGTVRLLLGKRMACTVLR